MCICVDCRWVDRCNAYHAVERQHGVDHLTLQPDFDPIEPSIHVNLMKMPDGGIDVEWDVRSCASFVEDLGRWLRLKPGEKLPT